MKQLKQKPPRSAEHASAERVNRKKQVKNYGIRDHQEME